MGRTRVMGHSQTLLARMQNYKHISETEMVNSYKIIGMAQKSLSLGIYSRKVKAYSYLHKRKTTRQNAHQGEKTTRPPSKVREVLYISSNCTR